MRTLCGIILAAAVASCGGAFAAVNFVECPRCDKRIRISDDRLKAFVNLSRIDASRKDEIAARTNRQVALFYYLWHGQHGTQGPYDVSKIVW